MRVQNHVHARTELIPVDRRTDDGLDIFFLVNEVVCTCTSFLCKRFHAKTNTYTYTLTPSSCCIHPSSLHTVHRRKRGRTTRCLIR